MYVSSLAHVRVHVCINPLNWDLFHFRVWRCRFRIVSLKALIGIIMGLLWTLTWFVSLSPPPPPPKHAAITMFIHWWHDSPKGISSVIQLIRAKFHQLIFDIFLTVMTGIFWAQIDCVGRFRQAALRVRTCWLTLALVLHAAVYPTHGVDLQWVPHRQLP